jgi:hypothetical protein
MGIRWPEIIICFQRWSQIVAATNLKTSATLTQLLEFPTVIAINVRQTQVHCCQVNCTDPTTLWRPALVLMHTVSTHGQTTRQREDLFLFTNKYRQTLNYIKLPTKRVTGIKRPEYEATHAFSSDICRDCKARSYLFLVTVTSDLKIPTKPDS